MKKWALRQRFKAAYNPKGSHCTRKLLKACPHCNWIRSSLNAHCLNWFQSTFDHVQTMFLQGGLGYRNVGVSSSYHMSMVYTQRKKLPNLGSNSWFSLPGSYCLTIKLSGTHPKKGRCHKPFSQVGVAFLLLERGGKRDWALELARKKIVLSSFFFCFPLPLLSSTILFSTMALYDLPRFSKPSPQHQQFVFSSGASYRTEIIKEAMQVGGWWCGRPHP